jgi:nitrite reductase/ring-hydroxylating ferredoxin subunit
MKKIIELEVAHSEDIKEGCIFPVKVKNHDGTDYVILIIRYGGKLYGLGGECTFANVIDEK